MGVLVYVLGLEKYDKSSDVKIYFKENLCRIRKK